LPPPSSHTTGHTVPYLAVHGRHWNFLTRLSSDTNLPHSSQSEVIPPSANPVFLPPQKTDFPNTGKYVTIAHSSIYKRALRHLFTTILIHPPLDVQPRKRRFWLYLTLVLLLTALGSSSCNSGNITCPQTDTLRPGSAFHIRRHSNSQFYFLQRVRCRAWAERRAGILQSGARHRRRPNPC